VIPVSTLQSIAAAAAILLECCTGWLSHVNYCRNCLKRCGPSKWFPVLEEPNFCEFFTKNSRTAWALWQRYYLDVICKHQAKFQFLFEEKPRVTARVSPSNNVDPLFDLLQDTQSEQCPSGQETNQRFLHLD
jgi:hypothetical protein